TIRVRPTSNYGRPITERSLGSNHISFRGKDLALRLTTDAPLAYIDREAPFVLTRPIHMVLGHRALARQQSHQLPRQGPRAAAHHRRAARLHRSGSALRPD